jgi:hypothetical protein
MAADTVTTTALTLALTDDLADTPARGVERAVCDQSIREAADLLLLAPSALQGRDVEVWLLRAGVHALSALVAERDAGGIVVTALASTHVEALLRAVLGHYALEGVASASIDAALASDPAVRALGFS